MDPLEISLTVEDPQARLRRFLSLNRPMPRNFQNPVFGELDREGWEELHYKHCIHHLEQFGLVQAR